MHHTEESPAQDPQRPNALTVRSGVLIVANVVALLLILILAIRAPQMSSTHSGRTVRPTATRIPLYLSWAATEGPSAGVFTEVLPAEVKLTATAAFATAVAVEAGGTPIPSHDNGPSATPGCATPEESSVNVSLSPLKSAEVDALELAIFEYRLAQKAALQNLDEEVIAQLPVFATGEALTSLIQQVAALRQQRMHQVLIVSRLKVQYAVPLAADCVGVLVDEDFRLQTLKVTAGGYQVIDEQIFSGQRVYGLVKVNARWKVDKVRQIESEE